MGKVLENGSKYNQYDANSDGIVNDDELKQAEEIMKIDHAKMLIENQDKREDAQRNMAWFALTGMLLYPACVVLADYVGLDSASMILGDMAATYFVSVAAIVAAFYGSQAYSK